MATTNEADQQRSSLRRRRRLRQLLGAVVCILVVIGLVSVISGGIRMTAKLFDDTEERLSYEQRLQVLVSLDPEPFDSLENANRTRLLHAAIWTVVQQNHDSLDAYERDDIGAMYLPTLDIDRVVASLYGPDFHFTYDSFTDNGLTFEYVPEKNAYLLPITSVNGLYAPRVVSIKREGHGVKRVTVGYLDLYGNGEMVFDPAKLEPSKYLDYMFTETDGEYYLSAILLSETQPESASSSSGASSASTPPQDQVLDNIVSTLPGESGADSSDAAVPSDTSSDSTDEDPASLDAETDSSDANADPSDAESDSSDTNPAPSRTK